MRTIAFSATEKHPERLKEHHFDDNTLLCKSENDVHLMVQVIDDAILRIRYAAEGHFERDFSYAIDEKFHGQITKIDLEETPSALVLRTPRVHLHIGKDRLQLKFTDTKGKVLSEDEKGFHWEENKDFGGDIVKMSRVVQQGEAFYGLGDKPMNLNLRGKRIVNWGTDEYGFHKDTDPIYKNIPIFYGLHHDIAYGIFFDNTFRSFFDFASERNAVASFWATGGEMNFYFLAGPDLEEIAINYTLLTGTPEIPPLWALGYQQCKWSYYPESEVREICATMRKHAIPCDAIYLDIDYMDEFRCFTWDLEKFPDPKKMIKDLMDQGFKTMVIIDPGIKKDKNYWVFQEALEKGYFCKRADGPYMNGKVWPGECYFPDFTNPVVRDWWAGLYKGLIEEDGVAGVWNDMNEPAVMDVPTKTFPLDVRHDFDGEECSHRKAHNVYGMQMARATYEGVKRFAGNKRSLIITRSGYAGLQRYSSVWTGDNIATWEHLSIANIQVQRLCASGISFCGSDVGGFIDQPSGELFVRWVQLAAFHPFFRTHSSGDHGDQEPWSFGEQHLKHVRLFIELRYKLLLYFYTTFYQYSHYGRPMVKSLAVYDSSDENVKNRMDESVVGDHILVCPILQPGVHERIVYLPKGEWYDYWTNKVYDGHQEVTAHADLNEMPIFIKAGAVIPEIEVMQYVGERPIDTIVLHVYYKDGKQDSQLYFDALDGYQYQTGAYVLSNFEVIGKKNKLTIVQNTKGDGYGHHDFKIILHGLPFKNDQVTVDKKIISASDSFKVDRNFQKIEITRK